MNSRQRHAFERASVPRLRTLSTGMSSWLTLLMTFLTFFHVADAGVVDDPGRSRNILPLPDLSDDSGGAQGSDFWRPFASQGIKALNELSGCVDFDKFSSRRKTTRAQRRVLSLINDAYAAAYPDSSCFADCDGLHGLCSSSRLYNTGKSEVMPYAEGNISWPQVASTPVPLIDCIPAADREWLGSWHEHMLVKDRTCQLDDIHTYVDPVLKNDKKAYGRFLGELFKRNMVKFKPAGHEDGVLGIFFVQKKSGQLRLIFDTRKMNVAFHEPPKTDLPSADAFTRLEFPDNEKFVFGSGDLANAFYTLSVPQDLAEQFTLPRIKASDLSAYAEHGLDLPPDAQILPYLTILPMGWSWALHFCQMVLMHAIKSAGFEERQIVGDKRAGVRIDKGLDIAVAGYVDNFGVFGVDPDAVNSGLARISERLRGLGLTVHEEEPARPTGQFVGLHFNGESGFISISPKRIRNIKSAIDELLSQQFCTGRTLQLLTGHCTWAMMTRREGLAILNSCYAFIHHFGSKPGRLWPSVRQELEWISSLLPLFRLKVNCGWAEDITASDSSPWGIGVCSRKLSRDVVSTLGSQCEKWRFRFNRGFDDENTAQHDSISNFILDKGFNEVPQDLLVAEDWKVVWSRPWKYKANILNTEARALAGSFEHILRANRCIGKRVLCLCDNMPVVLGCLKGRAKSGHLLKPLRHIAALSLATGSKVVPRWVVSEHNVADKPSRAIGAWHSAGLERWWDSFEPPEVQQFEHAQSKASRKSSKGDTPTASGAIRPGSKWNDILGSEKRAHPDSEGLSAADEKISELVFATTAAPGLAALPGRGSGGVSSRSLQPGQGEGRGRQDPCCRQVLHANIGQAFKRDEATRKDWKSSSTGPAAGHEAPAKALRRV